MLSPEETRELIAKHGTQKAAAEAIGVSDKSIRYWLYPEVHRERKRRQYAANPKREAERKRDYRAKNRDAVNARQRDWYDRLDGVGYNELLLKHRRQRGLKRMEERNRKG